MFGYASEGAEVSVSVAEDKVIDIDFTAYGEMGKTEYHIIESNISIWTTRYNMPFYLNGFDPKKIDDLRNRKLSD